MTKKFIAIQKSGKVVVMASSDSSSPLTGNDSAFLKRLVEPQINQDYCA